MRILLLNQFFVPDMAPTGRMLYDLARVLAARGHEVTVLCSCRSYDGGARYPAREILDGKIVVRRVPATGFGREILEGKLCDYASFYLLCAASLVVLRPKPDVVVSLTTPPYVGLLAKLIGKIRGWRHAHWVMDLYPDVMVAHGGLKAGSRLHKLLAWLTRRELKGGTVITLATEMAQRIETQYMPGARDGRVAWVPLWSHPQLSPWPEGQPVPLRRERGWLENELVLMYSGNMGLGHRFTEFLQAAARLSTDLDIRWAFAGGGRRREEIEQFVKANPVARVDLLPYEPWDRLRQHLCSADVLLASMDSEWEGCMVPNKLQAAFAVGKPVIFVGGPNNSLSKAIRESGGGWIVAEDDVKGLLAAVAQARDDAERKKRGGLAHDYALRSFGAGTNCRQVCQLIEGM